jgi:hypothetical protein
MRSEYDTSRLSPYRPGGAGVTSEAVETRLSPVKKVKKVKKYFVHGQGAPHPIEHETGTRIQ